MKGRRIRWDCYTTAQAVGLLPAGSGVNTWPPPFQCLCPMMSPTIRMRSTMNTLCSAQSGLALVHVPVPQWRAQRSCWAMMKVNWAWSHFVPLPLYPPAIHSIIYVSGVVAFWEGKPSCVFSPHGSDTPPESLHIKVKLQHEQWMQLWGQWNHGPCLNQGSWSTGLAYSRSKRSR